MVNIQQAKKELKEDCKKFMSFFAEGSAIKPEELPSIFRINKDVYRNLELILTEGSSEDKKEATIDFAVAMQPFKRMFDAVKAKNNFTLERVLPALKDYKFYDQEKVKMMDKLAKDLDDLANAVAAGKVSH